LAPPVTRRPAGAGSYNTSLDGRALRREEMTDVAAAAVRGAREGHPCPGRRRVSVSEGLFPFGCRRCHGVGGQDSLLLRFLAGLAGPSRWSGGPMRFTQPHSARQTTRTKLLWRRRAPTSALPDRIPPADVKADGELRRGRAKRPQAAAQLHRNKDANRIALGHTPTIRRKRCCTGGALRRWRLQSDAPVRPALVRPCWVPGARRAYAGPRLDVCGG